MWDQDYDLDEVLQRLHTMAAEREKSWTEEDPPPVTTRASTIDEIDAHERKLGRPIPDEIRKLYSVVGGLQLPVPPAIPELDPPWGGFLEAFEETEWAYCRHFEELTGKDLAWVRTDYFAFGRHQGWNQITYCLEPPHHPPGSIILLEDMCENEVSAEDSAGRLELVPFVVLAETLAGWLTRWMDHNFVEWTAVAPDGPEELSPKRELALRQDELRLNPSSRWLPRRIAHLKETYGMS